MTQLHRITVLCLAILVTFAAIPPLGASDVPAPPDSALRRMVGRLAQQRAGELGRSERPTPTPPKEELLRPEFRFKPTKPWLLLPELARALTTNETERAAVYDLLDRGVKETRRLLAAEKAQNDIAAATALFMAQLWQVARAQELPESDVDALHAQVAAALAGPEAARVSDAEKQKHWEYCLGLPIFVLGMQEIVSEESAVQDLRTIAAAGFETLIGISPHAVDIGPRGMVVRAGLESIAAAPGAFSPSRQLSSTPSPSQREAGITLAGFTYTAPADWSREQADWATIHRATLSDVNDRGEPDPNGSRQHAASMFVLPVRPAHRDATAQFAEIWREQFTGFELGDTIVHYRSRLKCGLVTSYMGRFFHPANAGADARSTYGVLYVIDLGGRVQPLIAMVVPGAAMYSMQSLDESAALAALVPPLAAVLDSIAPLDSAAPYPQGGFFSPAEIQGRWQESSSAFGGFYVQALTGAAAGAAVTSSGGHMHLRPDGTYDYNFAFASSHPQFGSSSGVSKHAGRYRLAGDFITLTPSQRGIEPTTSCAVGVGHRQTSAGLRRVLVTVGADSSGVHRAPPLIPNWDSYAGSMSWYTEE